MSTVYVVVTLLAAAMVGFSAVAVFVRLKQFVGTLAGYGVPESWWNWLGAAKATGAAGLVVGLVVPEIGLLAGACLVLYFIGAIVTVLRARQPSHLVFPVAYVAPVVASLTLGLSG